MRCSDLSLIDRSFLKFVHRRVAAQILVFWDLGLDASSSAESRYIIDIMYILRDLNKKRSDPTLNYVI